MDINVGIGLGLYVAGVVLLVLTLEEIFQPKTKWRWSARAASILTLVLVGVLFMTS